MIDAKDKPGCQPEFLCADKQILDIPGRAEILLGDLSQRTHQQALNALVRFHFNEELVTVEHTDQTQNENEL